MINKGRMYHNKLRSHDSNFAIHNASDEHNLRLKPENPNHDPSLSHLNRYEIYNPETGQTEIIDKPTPEHLQKLRDWQEEQKQEWLKKYGTKRNGQKQTQQLKDAKKAVKNWISGEKTTPEEINLFSEIFHKLENKEPIEDHFIKDFEEIAEGQTISRYNQKLKRLEELTQLTNDRPDRREIRGKRKQTEYLFKITDDSKITMERDQILKIQREFQRFFADHQIMYSVIHYDENPENPHLHFTVSNMNQRTLDYDLVQQEVEAIKQFQLEQTGTYSPYLDKQKSKMTDKELSQFGTDWQDFAFHLINKANPQQKIQKRTKQEVEEAKHQYEKTKPITQREHNRQKKLQEKAKEEVAKRKRLKEKTNETFEELEQFEMMLDKTQKELEQKQEEIQKKQTLLDSLEKKLGPFLSFAKKVSKWFKRDHQTQQEADQDYKKTVQQHEPEEPEEPKEKTAYELAMEHKEKKKRQKQDQIRNKSKKPKL